MQAVLHHSRKPRRPRRGLLPLAACALAAATSVEAATFFVTSTDPEGSGGIFEALANTTRNPGPDEIVFAVGSQTIFMTSPIDIFNGVALRAQGGVPTLDGRHAPSTTRGVVMRGSNTRVEGLAFRNYPNVGIEIRGTDAVVDDCILEGSSFGVRILAGEGERNILIGDESGMGNFVYGNTFGIVVEANVPDVRIVGNVVGIDEFDRIVPNVLGIVAGGLGEHVVRNVISGNSQIGLSVPGTGARVWDNNIGLTRDEMRSAANDVGLLVAGTNTQIGPTGPAGEPGSQGQPNVISGNARTGVQLSGTGATLSGNRIGLHRSLALAFPNGGDGVLVAGGSDNAVGDSFNGNEIGANGGHGIYLQGSSSSGNFLLNNTVGGDFPNALSGIRIEGADNTLDGNEITGNMRQGIEIVGSGAFNNQIDEDNRIEGNRGSGVRIVDASENAIQGTTFSGSPVIRDNGGNGIEIVAESGSAKQNSIRQVKVTDNDAFGIALFPNTQDGIEPPTTELGPRGGAFGRARPDALIDLYADPEEEGEFQIHSLGADANGSWTSFGSLALWAGMNLNATQSEDLNTSEYSIPLRIPGRGGTSTPPMPGDGICLDALDPQQVVPPTESDAFGRALVAVEEMGQSVVLRIDHTVANPTAAEIRQGRPGENGPSVLDLGSPASPVITGLSGIELHSLTAGDHYLIIASAGEPAGEIRGAFLCPEPGAAAQVVAAILALDLCWQLRRSPRSGTARRHA